MKDAKGHGSNSRGGSMLANGRGIMPSRPYRQGSEHQTAIAEQHGLPTAHLDADFGRRPTRALRSLSGSFDTRYEGEGY